MNIINQFSNNINNNNQFNNNNTAVDDNITNLSNSDNNKLKTTTLELNLVTVSDKILFHDKEFDNLESALKYAVKSINPFAYSVSIQNIKTFPRILNVTVSINYEEPKIIKKSFDILEVNNGSPHYLVIADKDVHYKNYNTIKDVVKHLVRSYYGAYENLVIKKIERNTQESKQLLNQFPTVDLYNVEVEFVDIPDICDIYIQNINTIPNAINVINFNSYNEPQILKTSNEPQILKTSFDILSIPISNNYFVDDKKFESIMQAVKYLVNKNYGNYQNLIIKKIEPNNQFNNEIPHLEVYKVEVEFIDMPDTKY